ncbi:MAG: hypothetical protein JST35_05470 [Armatimonadetes bacterium]|nr:hypothetical protein [Armatimonadota bacterium]
MKTTNKSLLGVVAALAVGQGLLHHNAIYPQWEQNYAPKTGNVVGSLAPDQIFLSLFGFREFLAGILWVKADGFFEDGNYDAVLPIIRLCTLLDPKQVDIYTTGMWHIAYNFTDEDNRSDRRYIPVALALGREGCKNNDYTYELFFETGWTWFHKIQDDFPKAVYYLEEARKRPDMLNARKNVLSQAYFRNGDPMKAVNEYLDLEAKAEDLYIREPTFPNSQNRDTVQKNLDNTLVRMAQRGWFAQNTDQGKSENWFSKYAYDTKPAFDTNFSIKVTVVEPNVFRCEGTWDVLPVGTRIRVILKDADYPNGRPAGMDWEGGPNTTVQFEPPKGITYMQDELYVKNRRFNKKLDLSRDPTMYSFAKDKYVLEFYYTPRLAPAHIQDKFGWNGEGMTDSLFLNTAIRPGQRVMYCKMDISKDMIRRRGEFSMQGGKTPVLKTPNYRETGITKDPDGEVIDINIAPLRSK